MTTIEKITVADREIAGELLAKRLDQHVNSGSIVLGISRGGAVVAAAVAEALCLPMNVLACRKLIHPGYKERSIGSVTVDDVILSNECGDIPRDYIGHQILLIRSRLRRELAEYNGVYNPVSIRYRTVVLVDDVSLSGDTLHSCIKSLRNQQPLRIIVAVPFISAKAARLIGEVADDVIFLRMDHVIKSPCDYYQDFREIDIQDVKHILAETPESINT